jgi:hypothetical protein
MSVVAVLEREDSVISDEGSKIITVHEENEEPKSVVAIAEREDSVVSDEGSKINVDHEENEQPKYNPLPSIQRHLTELITIARDTFQSRKPRTLVIYDYTRLQSRINKLFSTTKEQRFNFFEQYAYEYCLEMKALVQAIETGLRPYPEHVFKSIDWPASELNEQEEELAMATVHQVVDRLIWRGAKLVFPKDVERRIKAK